MAKEIDYSKRKKVWSTILTLLCVILCLAIIIIAFPLSTYIPRAGIDGTDYDADIVKANRYINKQISVVSHRGGSVELPENTLLAFKHTMQTYGTEAAISIDVRLTNDGALAVIHDETLDRTSNCEQLGFKKCRVADHKLNELKQFNLGYNFKDETSGEYIYRNASEETLKDLRICTLNDVLAAAKTIAEEQGKTIQDYVFYVNVMDDANSGFVTVSRVYNALKSYKILGNTVVTCLTDSVALFIDSNINTKDLKSSQKMIRAASSYEILEFYTCCMFNYDLSKKNVKYSVLNLPYRYLGIDFAKTPIVDYAHKYGLAVNYSVVNDKVELAYIESVGADGVISGKTGDALRMLK